MRDKWDSIGQSIYKSYHSRVIKSLHLKTVSAYARLSRRIFSATPTIVDIVALSA